MHVVPGPQPVQRVWPVAQIWLLSPTTHWMPLSQQPPWHGLLAEHFTEQIPWLQADHIGQSASLLQPHFPLGMQIGVAGSFVQSTQSPAGEPQAVSAIGTHRPFAQQVPLPHMPASAVQCEVQTPAAQVGVAPAHATQGPPSWPHARSAFPSTQANPSQHPALQGRSPTQELSHR